MSFGLVSPILWRPRPKRFTTFVEPKGNRRCSSVGYHLGTGFGRCSNTKGAEVKEPLSEDVVYTYLVDCTQSGNLKQ